MPTSQSNLFERAFPVKQLFRGTALAAVICSGLSSLFACLLLLDSYLIVDLLVGRGEVVLLRDEVQRYEKRTGGPSSGGGDLQRADQGMRSTVWAWAKRDKVGAEFLASVCRYTEGLHHNNSCFSILILAALALGLLNSLFLSRARILSLKTALNVVTRTRQILHRQTLRLGPSDLEEKENEYVLSLFTSDMERVRDAIDRRVSRLIRDPFILALLLMVALWIQWRLALQCLIPLAATWYLVQREKQRSETASRLGANRAEQELRLLAEDLRKTRLVRGYGMEAFERDRFQKHLERFRNRVSLMKRG